MADTKDACCHDSAREGNYHYTEVSLLSDANLKALQTSERTICEYCGFKAAWLTEFCRLRSWPCGEHQMVRIKSCDWSGCQKKLLEDLKGDKMVQIHRITELKS